MASSDFAVEGGAIAPAPEEAEGSGTAPAATGPAVIVEAPIEIETKESPPSPEKALDAAFPGACFFFVAEVAGEACLQHGQDAG